MPRHPPYALHSLSHTPPTQPPPHHPTKQRHKHGQNTGSRCTHATTNATDVHNSDSHKETQAHPRQSNGTCHHTKTTPKHKQTNQTDQTNFKQSEQTKQTAPTTPPTQKEKEEKAQYGAVRCSRPLSRSQTTTPHHHTAPPHPRATGTTGQPDSHQTASAGRPSPQPGRHRQAGV